MQRLSSHRLVGVEFDMPYTVRRIENSACARDEFAQHLRVGCDCRDSKLKDSPEAIGYQFPGSAMRVDVQSLLSRLHGLKRGAFRYEASVRKIARDPVGQPISLG